MNAAMQGPCASRSWWSSACWASWFDALAQRSRPSVSASISPAPSAPARILAASTTCCRVGASPRSRSSLYKVPMLAASSAGSIGMRCSRVGWRVGSQATSGRLAINRPVDNSRRGLGLNDQTGNPVYALVIGGHQCEVWRTRVVVDAWADECWVSPRCRYGDTTGRRPPGSQPDAGRRGLWDNPSGATQSRLSGDPSRIGTDADAGPRPRVTSRLPLASCRGNTDADLRFVVDPSTGIDPTTPSLPFVLPPASTTGAEVKRSGWCL